MSATDRAGSSLIGGEVGAQLEKTHAPLMRALVPPEARRSSLRRRAGAAVADRAARVLSNSGHLGIQSLRHASCVVIQSRPAEGAVTLLKCISNRARVSVTRKTGAGGLFALGASSAVDEVGSVAPQLHRSAQICHILHSAHPGILRKSRYFRRFMRLLTCGLTVRFLRGSPLNCFYPFTLSIPTIPVSTMSPRAPVEMGCSRRSIALRVAAGLRCIYRCVVPMS